MNIQIKKNGSMTCWGDWFGRPMDNYHIVERAVFNEEALAINFNENVSCTVYNPLDIVSTEEEFSIADASRVLLSFERTKGRIYHIAYEKTADNYIVKREFAAGEPDIVTNKFYKGGSKAFEIH